MVDGYFIRSLLLSFFFKVLPEIVLDGRIYIAEPPLYRVNDPKNPFVINNADYLNRYVSQASKEYKIGYRKNEKSLDTEWLDKKTLTEFLDDTKNYVKTIIGDKGKGGLVNHYKTNDRLLEMVMEELVLSDVNIEDENFSLQKEVQKINIQHMMNRIGTEFNELYFDDNHGIIRGVIDNKWQDFEILPEGFVMKAKSAIRVLQKWMPPENGVIVLRNSKTNSEQMLSMLGCLKILQKYQPDVVHRYKGLGENSAEDIRTTIMDPNTRTLIRVNVGDYENDMKIFQILRGNTPLDMAQRRTMLKQFEVNPEDIDT